MTFKTGNNLSSTLSAQLLSGGTSVTLQTGQGANWAAANGTDYILAVLYNTAGTKREIVKVTNRSGDTLTISRNQETIVSFSPPYQFEVGDFIESRVTKGTLDFLSNIDNLLPSQTGNAGKILKTDGTNSSWVSKRTVATEQNTTSGTSIDFTGIPAGVTRISVLLNAVSTTSGGTVDLLIQLGDSGGVETSGYTSYATYLASGTGTATSTAGFRIAGGHESNNHIGIIDLQLLNSSTNTWVCSGLVSFLQTGINIYVTTTNGVKATSSVLDRIRLTTVSGTATFDSGSMTIIYE